MIWNDIALQPYFDLLPTIILSFVVALLLTPLVGTVARKLDIVDLPASLRQRTDPSIAQRIHKKIKPRLGGIAVLIPMIFVFFTQVDLTPQLWGLIIGLGVLIVSGILDDNYELSGKWQFLAQFIAAAIVIISGTSIPSIQVAGINLDFSGYMQAVNLFGFTYNMVLPGDLITLLWIVGIINAVNWVSGIDALGEGLTLVASVTLMLLTVKLGNPMLAVVPAALIGGLLGFIPYNFPPSKILSGTAGDTSYGFLLATLSMLNGAKITTAIILLSLPLLDMAWVIFYRMRVHKDKPLLARPFVSGRVHLHHRIMALGFSSKQTLGIEVIMMALISIVAFYFGGFSSALLAFAIIATVLLILFAVIALGVGRFTLKAADKTKELPEPEDDPDDGLTPEEKYAY